MIISCKELIKFNNQCIEVEFTNKQKNDEKNATESSFNNFINLWNKYYLENKEFCFFFDTSKLSSASPIYSIRLALFIKKLKQKPKQYLNFSIIILSNKIIRFLFDLILKIEKPVAPIYIVSNQQIAKELLEYKLTNSVILESFILLNHIKVINP